MIHTDKFTDRQPLVSVVIVNWNGWDTLPRCLEALASQSFEDFEVILVDNASSDGSADEAEMRWPHMRVIRLEENLGFAAANNLGARKACGRWLALLNNDAFPEPDWLEELIHASQSNSNFNLFASKIIQSKNPAKIDGTGDIYHVSGLAWHRDYNQPLALAHNEADEVFSPCAAAAFYKREIFLEVGGFDEDFISHHEDVDLGFRLRLLGHRCLYVPQAIVEHIGSASYGVESDPTVYQVHRNLVWTFVKYLPGILLLRYLPAHILANMIFLVYYSLRGQGRVIMRAKLDAILGLPRTLRKRRLAQASRAVSVEEIARVLDKDWLSPYVLGKRAGAIQKVSEIFGLGKS